MNIDEAMTVEASEQTAQDALVALQVEVERLRAIEARLRDDYYSDKDPHGTLGRYLGEG